MSTRPILAVTGGTGFVGRHLVRQAAEAGWEVRALSRSFQPPLHQVTWVGGSLEDKASLVRLCEGAEAVVHVAGVVNAPDRAGFVAGNVTGTLNMVEAAKEGGVPRFIHVSSLAAREPDLSAYGWSKARSEQVVAASGLAWTIVRPPAVYGPGDKELLLVFRAAARGWFVSPATGRLSLIHAEDFNRLLLRIIGEDIALLATYEPDDGRPEGWTHREFAGALGEAVGRPQLRFVRLPAFILHAAADADRLIRRGRAQITRDRVGYMLHPDWVARAEHHPPPALWRPKIGTYAGLKATAEWYRAEGWLRR